MNYKNPYFIFGASLGFIGWYAGGVLGGVIGAIAGSLIVSIGKRNISSAQKIALSVIITLGAVIGYLTLSYIFLSVVDLYLE